MTDLWAITCFFNPAGYRRRVQNYRWFREHLDVPLVTVELSFTGEFALGPADADVLVQLNQGDILFQKERLLNIALEQVPSSCRGIVWIDCDVIFADPQWSRRTLEALDRFAVVQPFRERYDLLPDSTPANIAQWDRPYDRLSLMAKLAEASIAPSDFEHPERPPIGVPAYGLAWAARKDVLDRHGLYDACVLTGGDTAIFGASIGVMESPFMRVRFNERSFQHYLDWASPFYQTVQGSVSYVEGRLFHLWHGAIEDRRYSTCMRELRDLDFDPYIDLELTGQRTWRWSSDKPELHAHVREYFPSRKEDGVSAAGV